MSAEPENAADVRFARICCYAMALGLFVGGAASMLDPSLRHPRLRWHILLTEPGWFLTARVALVAAAVAGLGVAAALRNSQDVRRHSHRAWASWLFRLAQLTFFLTALAQVQLASLDVPYVRLDPQGRLWLGGLGAWITGVNLLGIATASQPKRVVIPGLATGVLLSLVPITVATGHAVLWWLAVAGGSMLAAPLWLVKLGEHFTHTMPGLLPREAITPLH